MNEKKIIRTVFLLFCVRIAISFSVSDGTVRSDSLNYLGLTYHLMQSGTCTAVTPVDESAIRNGVTVREFFEYFDHHPTPYRRSMNFQWLHALAFIPFLAVFPSVYTIIFINNLLFLGAGFFLFEMIRSKVPHVILAGGWGVYLFFPPFFYLTNQFYSEPMFVFFLAIVLFGLVRKQTKRPLFIIALILLPVTRGFGLLIVAGIILSAFFFKEYRLAVTVLACGVAAVALNALVGANDRDPHAITIPSPPPVLHSMYFTNTINGNGDNDYFLVFPEKQQEDRFFSAYLNGDYSSSDLATEVIAQNIRQPDLFFTTLTNRIGAYFLNIIPDSWNYESKPNQSLLKKILWTIQNGGLLAILLIGLGKCDPLYRRYFVLLFWISCAAHLIALSRYRYFQPVLIAGIPAVTYGLNAVRDRIMQAFKKENALPK
jgi:hypothetical protein